MRIRRRSLRKLLVAVGCAVGTVTYPAAAIGGLLILSGSVLHVWSKGCLEQNRRLTTAGPYRFSRNPFYFANLLIDLGLCFVIGAVWLAAAFLPIWWISYRETIEREEARLLELFPDEFPDYLHVVPRLVPTGRRLPAAQAQGVFAFSNRALTRGSEYARLVGVLLAPATIYGAQIVRRERMAIFDGENEQTLACIVFLAGAWVIKLALAETFRRPQTALVPFKPGSITRSAITIPLAAIAFLVGQLWAIGLPLLWIALLTLDRVGVSRMEIADHALRQPPWRYFPFIAAGTFSAAAAIWVASLRA